MAKKKQLEIDNKQIYPITNEKLVLDDDGISLPSKYIKKGDTPDLSNYSTKKNTGELKDLPSIKTDFVSAINEIVYKSDNQRLSMITILKNIGCANLTDESTWTDILNSIKSDNFIYSSSIDSNDLEIIKNNSMVNTNIHGGITNGSAVIMDNSGDYDSFNGSQTGLFFVTDADEYARVTFENENILGNGIPSIYKYKTVEVTLFNPNQTYVNNVEFGIWTWNKTNNNQISTWTPGVNCTDNIYTIKSLDTRVLTKVTIDITDLVIDSFFGFYAKGQFSTGVYVTELKLIAK